MKYSFQCKECGKVTEVIRKLEEYDNPYQCECGGDGERVILKAPTVSLDPICGDHIGATDRWVKGRERQMKKEAHNMKEHGSYT